MNKEIIAILVGVFILFSAIGYNFYIKNSFKKEIKEINSNIEQIEYINNLKKVWSPKGIKSKIKQTISSISNKKIELKRSKATISLKNLSDRELNRVLGKLASMPINFKLLNINKSGDKFNMECKCDW